MFDEITRMALNAKRRHEQSHQPPTNRGMQLGHGGPQGGKKKSNCC